MGLERADSPPPRAAPESDNISNISEGGMAEAQQNQFPLNPHGAALLFLAWLRATGKGLWIQYILGPDLHCSVIPPSCHLKVSQRVSLRYLKPLSGIVEVTFCESFLGQPIAIGLKTQRSHKEGGCLVNSGKLDNITCSLAKSS